MGGENSFKGSQQRIVFFAFFSHGSYKVKWCDRAKEEGNCGYFLIGFFVYALTHTYYFRVLLRYVFNYAQ